MATKATYTAFCNLCYGFHRESNKLREIEMEATGHMQQFRGHEVHINKRGQALR